MGWESTVTEQDMDATSLPLAQGLATDGKEIEPDLAVDGLSESIFSRLIGVFRFAKP